MLITPFRDWLSEQENRRGPAVFLLEWVVIFAGCLIFWAILLLEIRHSPWSVALALAISSIYASAATSLRVSGFQACAKCRASLALNRVELSRRCIRDEERCLEIERGGQEWYGHFIDLYSRTYRVVIVKYRCRRCAHVWEQTIMEPACDYRLVRTIDVKD